MMVDGAKRRDRAGLAARAAAAALACAFLTFPASAQNVAPSQITPSTLRPAAPQTSGVTIANPAGAPAPAGAEKLSITLARIVIEGGFPELQTETDAILSTIRGRRVTLKDVYDAVAAIERAYSAHGWVLVRVSVPPQKLDNGGTLRLAVIDGFIESIDVSGVPARQRDVIAARAAPLIGRRHIKLDEIERRLLLAADDPAVSLTSTLARGNAPGATRLVLDGTEKLATGSIGFNNQLPPSLSTYEWTSTLAINSALGRGEQFYVSGTTGYDLGKVFDGTTPVGLVGVGAVIPLGDDGLKINPEYTYSVTREAPVPGSPATVGYYQRFDLRALYPLILTRAQTLNVQATLEWARESLVATAFGADLYLDSYRVMRLQAEDRYRFPIGAIADATLIFSQGLGGRNEADALATGVPLSQQGASPDFTKLGFNARWTQFLPENLQGVLIASAQTSFGKPLFIAEQIGLDGLTAASGYPIGTFTVDQGATLRGELIRPIQLFTPASTSIAPYVFAEGGSGEIFDATILQQARINAGSFGVGVRTGLDAAGLPFNGTFDIELARGYSNVPGEKQVNRCNFSIGLNF
jgi:hemolysin activation/secretion protein